jgi:Ca-activated chloride channel family protein
MSRIDRVTKEKEKIMKMFILLFLFAVSVAYSQGRIIISEQPLDSKITEMELRSTKTEAVIKSGIASVTVEQVFHNPTNRRLEGEYVFMLPAESQVHDFHLYIDGKKVKGELLDGKQAAEIYRNIVRTLRDPALLEYAGCGVFKARIFPIEPKSERKIELSYAQILKYQKNDFKFTYPIRQAGIGKSDNFYLSLTLQEQISIGNIYSPSHSIQVQRPDPTSARITLEEKNTTKDFNLYYSISENDIHHTLLSFRPRTDRDGFFILLLKPDQEKVNRTRISKDVIFVTDVSGSMQGDKIQQAKAALKFCVNALHPDDRFDIIAFSSTIQFFQGNLRPAGQDAKRNAEYFIDNLNASGGTNINEALQRSLALKNQEDRRSTDIIFLTDGLPTEGVTDIANILANISQTQKEFIRIFTFGVGFDVNTYLLDKLSQDTRGRADYVKPGEAIEAAISSLFGKISSPFLTDVTLEFEGVRVLDFYPPKISDIYQGERVTLLGRYSHSGQAKIILQGKQADRHQRFSYTVQFPNRETENEFISKLWANRKVHHLLSEIRFNGENPELVESIKSLGKEYGIITPYTSYLVREQQVELAMLDDRVVAGEGGVSQNRLHDRQKERETKAEADDESVGSEAYYEAFAAVPFAAEKSAGKAAVLSSRALKKLEIADKDVEMLLTVQRIAGRTFTLRRGIWVENDIELQSKPHIRITFLSDAYFKLLDSDPELPKILGLGEQVSFQWNGKIISIEL